jgi:hypothetical protein
MIFSVPDAPLQDMAFEGKALIVTNGCGLFGNGKGYTATVDSPTWGELLRVAVDSQEATGDLHHNFFEGLDHVATVLGDNISVYSLILGS